MRESRTNSMSHETLLNRMMDYFYESKVITTSKIQARSKCVEKKFGLYVTNPCFEFWLLLHFDEVFELDPDKLLENSKVTAKRRYAEQELRRIYPQYGKNSYKAVEIVKHIDKAIENEKKFCEDVVRLKNKVGSNLGRLIEEMKS